MMQSDDARYLKRKVKAGNIDVHPTEKAIVVYYEVEATILGELGDPMLGEKKECQKVIRLQSLNESTDIRTLAREVIDRCKLIPVAKLPEVEQLLYYLQKRKADKNKTSKDKRSLNSLQDPAPELLNEVNLSNLETPSINNLDEYVELLYEDVPSKIKASILIFCLIKNSDNLEALIDHGTVMGALSRVLREDWRKSVELSTNIIYIFFSFSTYLQFHQTIAHYKIGALCLSIADFEMKRLDSWKEELEKKKELLKSDNSETEEDLKEYEKIEKKFQSLTKKQDQLLKVAFYLLLNLAEDPRVEMKMKNKGIVRILIKAVESRTSPSLLIVVISFLKKLSIFRENKNEMSKLNIIPKLADKLLSKDQVLSSLTIRLLLNLSFDTTMRSQMVASEFIPRVLSCLDKRSCEAITLCLLYHLSTDAKNRNAFAYNECAEKLIGMILEAPIGPIYPELAALVINVATSKKFSQLVCKNKTVLQHLVKRVFKCKDGLLLKMIRNMSQHDSCKLSFVTFISYFANAVKKEKDEDFVVECIGTLANMNMSNINFDLVLKKYKLLSYLMKILKSDQFEDDLVLEAIVLVGTVAIDENCASTLAQCGMVQTLVELLNAKQQDDEVVLQIAYVFYQMIWHEETRNIIISNTQAPAYLIDLMHDRNTSIRKVCENTLDIIREYDSEWEKRIQLEKFRWHNSQWIDIVGNETIEDEEDDDMLPDHYYGDDLLLYEPNFDDEDDEMLIEGPTLQPEFFSKEALNEGLANGTIISPGYNSYLPEYSNENLHDRLISHGEMQNLDAYYSPNGYMSNDYMSYNY